MELHNFRNRLSPIGSAIKRIGKAGLRTLSPKTQKPNEELRKQLELAIRVERLRAGWQTGRVDAHGIEENKKDIKNIKNLFEELVKVVQEEA
jgi:hypothetical protein